MAQQPIAHEPAHDERATASRRIASAMSHASASTGDSAAMRLRWYIVRREVGR
jgi:hypothetical protein